MHGYRYSRLSTLFIVIAILGAIIVLAALLGIAGAFKHRKGIIIVYMIIVVIALVFQVVIGVKVYQKGANTASYLAPLWSTGTNSFRETLQNEVCFFHPLCACVCVCVSYH